MDSCVICGSPPQRILERAALQMINVDCERCGKYSISYELTTAPLPRELSKAVSLTFFARHGQRVQLIDQQDLAPLLAKLNQC